MKAIGIQYNDNNDNGEILDLKVSVVRDASGQIASGLVIGNTLEQNKASILIAHQGEFKFNPDLGVGLGDIALSSDYLEYRHKIREHFAKDGLVVETLDLFENKPLKIVANYE
ncbi:hypothetical protein MW871_15090 [Flavobacterium sp. I-SCBP12n]|uniref:Uncharacterized protein n=1 Tax=Flavobacterium pygoscelis TaxID=2893176 RepID=A0A9X2BM44_9FLAO|nr:hypothetical protein [Flavobacterium pygoscelis]MCK8143214.1 hypothetical protein [Flavobacterium pygoscelis]